MLKVIQYPKVIIFDLDGVIIDTAEFHFLAWKRLAEDLDISIDRQFNEQLKGISRMESLERILELSPTLEISFEEKLRYANQKNNHYLELVESINSNYALPGIDNLIRKIAEQNIKIALGSASKNALKVLDKLELTKYFDHVVDASKVKKGKPDPETFKTAANFFNSPYSECIGIEDAIAGVEAINKANMFSVGVGSLEHLSHADYLVGDTSDLIFEKIVKRYNEKKDHNK